MKKSKQLDIKHDVWETISTGEAAKFLKISKQKMYRLINAGKIKTINIGTGNIRQHYRIEVKEIERFIHG